MRFANPQSAGLGNRLESISGRTAALRPADPRGLGSAGSNRSLEASAGSRGLTPHLGRNQSLAQLPDAAASGLGHWARFDAVEIAPASAARNPEGRQEVKSVGLGREGSMGDERRPPGGQ